MSLARRSVHTAEFSQHELDTIRQRNLGHLMHALAADFDRRMLAHYADAGYGDIRPAHGAVLRNLETAGSRVSTLACRARLTHRAVTKLVIDLEHLGYVCREPDPEDARASLVRYAPRGQSLLSDSRQYVSAVYGHYAGLTSSTSLQALETSLHKAISALPVTFVPGGMQDRNRPDLAPNSDAVTASHLTHSLGRYLTELAADYQRRCKTLMTELGHPGVRGDHLAVLTHLEAGGMDHSALAAKAGVSIQAIGKQLRAVEKLAYVESHIDPEDRRVRRVVFTARGFAYIRALLEAFAQIEAHYSQAMGSRQYRQLLKQLQQLAAAAQLQVPRPTTTD